MHKQRLETLKAQKLGRHAEQHQQKGAKEMPAPTDTHANVEQLAGLQVTYSLCYSFSQSASQSVSQSVGSRVERTAWCGIMMAIMIGHDML